MLTSKYLKYVRTLNTYTSNEPFYERTQEIINLEQVQIQWLSVKST